MKREIKFRGKCSRQSKYAGQWVYGNLIVPEEIQGDEVMIVKALSDDASCTYHVDVNSVGQFTGRNDKNGKEIYEGDILKPINREQTCQVLFSERSASYILVFVSPDKLAYDMGFYDVERFFEVIGNIYDNKELLED